MSDKEFLSHDLGRILPRELSWTEVNDLPIVVWASFRDASARQWLSAAGILVSCFTDQTQRTEDNEADHACSIVVPDLSRIVDWISIDTPPLCQIPGPQDCSSFRAVVRFSLVSLTLCLVRSPARSSWHGFDPLIYNFQGYVDAGLGQLRARSSNTATLSGLHLTRSQSLGIKLKLVGLRPTPPSPRYATPLRAELTFFKMF